MKLKTPVIVLLLLFGLKLSAQTNADKLIAQFNTIIDFEGKQVNQSRPIADINKLAAQQADTILLLTKENAKTSFDIARKYAKAILTVDRHTIVKIESWKDCKKSGSWDYEVPRGIGFIQRNGELNKHEDYINFIIGSPNTQRRAIFLFK